SPAATTHTDGRGRSKQERHTRLHRMCMRRERSVVSAPHTEGAHTHKKVQRTQQHNSKVTIQKKIPAHHADCWSTGSAANIHHKNSSVAFGLRPHSSQTTSCRPGHHRSSRKRKYKHKERNNASNHLFVFLFGCWRMSACFFSFLRRVNLHAWIVCFKNFRKVHNYLFSLVNFYCVGAANNSVCVLPAFRW
ncbi:hypothetical protein TcCL_Unassigned03257, partial [Trypanosoma cruzi]